MCSSRRGEASADNAAWSLYGAQRSQLVATGRKWEGVENGSDKRKPLPWVATRCLSRSMVRRGSTVRVRQRALQNRPVAWASVLSPESTQSASTRVA